MGHFTAFMVSNSQHQLYFKIYKVKSSVSQTKAQLIEAGFLSSKTFGLLQIILKMALVVICLAF